MSVRVADLRKWLDQYTPSDAVGIDEDGLSLVGPNAAYYEIGGIPDPQTSLFDEEDTQLG